jgi:adenylyl cyclase-associated protein
VNLIFVYLQVTLLEKEFTDFRALLLTASACQKPDQKAFGELLNPLQADIEAVTRLKQPNRKDRDWVNHLATVAEGAPCAGWVTYVSYHCLQSISYFI